MRDERPAEAAAYPAQADALDIEAQARGEVQRRGGRRRKEILGGKFKPTAADIGLDRRAIQEARQIRDAEKRDPGIVRRTLDAAVKAGKGPTKADVNCHRITAAV